LFVQLPNYDPKGDSTGESWAWLRDAQTAALSLPHVGMAVTLDIGDPVNLHPANKKDVGKRLSLIALRQVFNRNIEDSGPTYESLERDGHALLVKFSHAKGLAFRGSSDGLFKIAGADRKFVSADAKIDGDRLIVSSQAVSAPVAVRFSWENNPHGFLVNQDSLLAAPFRSDQW
jgi:sialate O-acetylesterase